MKAKQYSYKRYPILLAFLLIIIISSLTTSVNAQCPTVTNSVQSLCDVQSVLVGDLQATDNGGGIVWYASATSTDPLSNSDSLISGEDYYADDNTGSCGTRARVDITIYGPPVGDNFQGVCLDDPSLATVSSLVATGNEVQWYLSSSGGAPLNDTDLLIDNTIYYADQASPDGSCRTSRLSVLVFVGSTPVPVGDMVQNFCVTPEFTPTIGDLVASGTNNWYISLFSALPLPPSTPLINGQTYYATTLDPPCESTGRLTVLAILDPAPNAGEDGLLELCENNTGSTIDLFTELEGSPDSGGTWTPTLNSGTGIYDPNIDVPGTYTYTVNSNNSCPDESATVTITEIPEPNAGTDGTLELCSNSDAVDLFLSLGGTPEIGGVWTPALASGTGVFNPAIDSEGIYTYTVSGTAPCIDATATVNVSISTFNDAGEDGSIDICNNSATIDLFDSLGGTPDIGGVWSPALTSGTGVFDPSMDSPGVYSYQFIGNAPCPDVSATVTVTVNPLPNAGSNSTLEICSNDLATVDLFDTLGGTPEMGGTWSPTLNSGTGVFDPAVDAAGIYTYTLNGIDPCPDVSADVNVIIIQEPNAGLDAVVDICSNNGTVDLFEILQGSPETGGTWSPALNSGTGVYDPLLDTNDTYTYTVTGTNPCADASATITITVIPFQNAGADGSVTVCTDDGTIDLFDSLGGSPQLGGTWSPALTSGTGIFDPNVDTEGTYTYSTSGTGPCSDDSAIVEVTLELSPDAGLDATLDLCSFSNTVDLFDSLNGTPQTGGTWLPVLSSGTGIFNPNIDPEGIYTYTIASVCGTSSATVTVSATDANTAGTNGAVEFCSTDTTIIDLFDRLGGTPDVGGTWSPSLSSGTGVFDPSIDTANIYTYTVSNSANPCPDDSATVTVSIVQEPNAGNDGTLNLCGSTASVDLFNSLAGTPETGGIWSPTLNSATGIFDPNTDPEGIYTYTLNNSCGNSSATVTVSFSDTNDAGTDGAVELCSTDASVDLFNSLGGTPDTGGTWSPALASGTGVFDPAVDVADIYTYTISSPGTCPDATVTVVVSIVLEPNAGNDGTLNLCSSTDTADLFDGLTGLPETGGTWTPTLTSGTGIFDPNTDPEGVYTYTINNACGTSSANVTVSFSDANNAGTDGAIELCSSDASVDLFDSLGGTPDTGGTWSPTLASGTGVFDPTVDAAGTYTYTISNAGSTCPDATANVEVTIVEIPNAGSDGTLELCSSDSDLIDLIVGLDGTPDAGGTWSPALNSGTGEFDVTIDAAGIYTYTINNACGTSSATVSVSISIANDAGSDGSIEFCSNDAAADLFDSLGGTPQTGGTWTPALTSGTGVFDPSIDAAGTYIYTIFDDTSACPEVTASVTVTILAIPNAGSDETQLICINETDPVDLFESLGGNPETGGTWTPALTSGTGVFDPTIDLPGIYTYSVTSTACNITSSADVTVNIIDLPDVTDLRMSMDDNVVCVGLEDAIVNITGATQLPDGDYSIVYVLSGDNNSVNTVAITVTGGNATFTIPQVLLENSGLTLVTLSQLFVLGQNCSALTDLVEPLKIFVEDPPTPELIDNGTEFCLEDNPTVEDLSNNINSSETIIWYDAPIDGNPYDSGDDLQEGIIYYGVIQTEYGCESTIRLEVTVSFISCIGDLLIPDGFSPNGDGINDVFDILWINDLYPNFKLSIYNRYGNILYEGDINSPKWDGTSKKKSTALPAGVYFYILEFNDGEREAQQGRVYLNR